MGKNGKILKFDLSKDAIQVRNILQQQFLNIRIKAISDIFPNRNKSHFTKESMSKALPTFFNKPILCNYLVDKDDRGGHDSNGMRYDIDNDIMFEDYESDDSEKIIGVIRESDKVELVEEDGLNWIYANCCLFIAYNYRLVKSLLRSKGCKVSVEVEVLDSYIDDDGIEIITDFELLGISLLGSNLLEAIPTASMTILDLQKTERYTKQFKAIKFAYKKLEESTDESTNPDFKDTVINEHKDEIEFNKNSKENFEKGEIASMTFIEKRQILETALSLTLKTLNIDTYHWVEDLDGEYVYFTVGDEQFKAKYELFEGGANIDYDNREYVIRSWRTYSEEEMKDKDKKDFKVLDPNSTVGNTEAHIQHDDDEAGININLHDKDVPGNFSKENEFTDEGSKEENVSKEECASEESKEENCKMSSDEGEENKEGIKESESKETEDCDCDDNDEHKEENSTDESKEECASKEENCKLSSDEKEQCVKEECEKQEESTVRPTIISEDTYTTLKNEFTALKKEHEILMKQYKEKVQNEQLRFAQEFVNNEPDLSSENSKNVFNVIETAIKAEKFTSNEDVEIFAVQEIATALYNQRKEQRNEEVNNKKNSFSCDIHREKVSFTKGATDDDIDSLKSSREALENI